MFADQENKPFNPGPSKEDLKKFQVPKWRSDLPDIKMQKKDLSDMSPQERELYERMSRYEGSIQLRERESSLENFLGVVRRLAKEENPEQKELLRSETAQHYESLCHSQIDEIGSINWFLENLKTNVQYDTRFTIELMKRMIRQVNMELRKEGELDVEAKALLKMVKKDLIWTHSLSRIEEACGPSYEIYYDGELEMAQLRTVHRTEILASDFVNVFSKDIAGLELTGEEENLVSKTLNKINKEGHVDSAPNTESLREKAVEYQDQYNYWEFAIAAAAQKNLEKGFKRDDETTEHYLKREDEAKEHYMDIDPTTFRFLNKLMDSELTMDDDSGDDLVYITFEDGQKIEYKVKGSVINIYDMPKASEELTRRYYATTEELVLNSQIIRKALEDINNADDTLKEQLIDELAAKYILRANQRIKNWSNRDVESSYDRLAETVIRGMINLDKGMFACGELGWHYEYSKKYLDEMNQEELEKYSGSNTKQEDKIKVQTEIKDGRERKFIVERVSELGSIYDNHDLTTVVFPARHIIDYDNFAETRGTILQPSIGSYRSRWRSEPPYWKPTFKEFAPKDRFLNNILKLWMNDGFKNDPARKVYAPGKRGRYDQFFGELDPQIKAYIRENAWPFVTPWLSEPGKGGDEYFLSQIVLLPTCIKEINGWRNFALEEPLQKVKSKISQDGKTKEKVETIWHNRINGLKLSDLKWQNLNKYGFHWFRVNTDQMSRWLGPWITLHDYNKLTADEFVKHNAMPGGKAEKESGKRGKLGGRGAEWNAGVIRATMLAQAKIFASVSAAKIMSMPHDLNLNVNLDKWRNDWIGPWINTLMDMPREVGKVENYNGTVSQIMLGTYYQTRRIVKSAIKHNDGQVSEVNHAIKTLEKRILS